MALYLNNTKTDLYIYITNSLVIPSFAETIMNKAYPWLYLPNLLLYEYLYVH